MERPRVWIGVARPASGPGMRATHLVSYGDVRTEPGREDSPPGRLGNLEWPGQIGCQHHPDEREAHSCLVPDTTPRRDGSGSE